MRTGEDDDKDQCVQCRSQIVCLWLVNLHWATTCSDRHCLFSDPRAWRHQPTSSCRWHWRASLCGGPLGSHPCRSHHSHLREEIYAYICGKFFVASGIEGAIGIRWHGVQRYEPDHERACQLDPGQCGMTNWDSKNSLISSKLLYSKNKFCFRKVNKYPFLFQESTGALFFFSPCGRERKEVLGWRNLCFFLGEVSISLFLFMAIFWENLRMRFHPRPPDSTCRPWTKQRAHESAISLAQNFSQCAGH